MRVVNNLHKNNSELVGLYEVAEMANVRPSAVANWRNRFSDFPKPIADLKSGPVFLRAQIQAWLRKRNPGERRKMS